MSGGALPIAKETQRVGYRVGRAHLQEEGAGVETSEARSKTVKVLRRVGGELGKERVSSLRGEERGEHKQDKIARGYNTVWKEGEPTVKREWVEIERNELEEGEDKAKMRRHWSSSSSEERGEDTIEMCGCEGRCQVTGPTVCNNAKRGSECSRYSCTVLHSGAGNCGNQRSKKLRRPRLRVGDTERCGVGLFSTGWVSEGRLIGEWIGEVRRRRQGGKGVQWRVVLNEEFELDAEKKGTILRYTNHSCTPNAIVRVVRVDGEQRCFMFALRQLEKEEEITVWYGKEELQPEWLLGGRCQCGSKECVDGPVEEEKGKERRAKENEEEVEAVNERQQQSQPWAVVATRSGQAREVKARNQPGVALVNAFEALQERGDEAIESEQIEATTNNYRLEMWASRLRAEAMKGKRDILRFARKLQLPGQSKEQWAQTCGNPSLLVEAFRNLSDKEIQAGCEREAKRGKARRERRQEPRSKEWKKEPHLPETDEKDLGRKSPGKEVRFKSREKEVGSGSSDSEDSESSDKSDLNEPKVEKEKRLDVPTEQPRKRRKERKKTVGSVELPEKNRWRAWEDLDDREPGRLGEESGRDTALQRLKRDTDLSAVKNILGSVRVDCGGSTTSSEGRQEKMAEQLRLIFEERENRIHALEDSRVVEMLAGRPNSEPGVAAQDGGSDLATKETLVERARARHRLKLLAALEEAEQRREAETIVEGRRQTDESVLNLACHRLLSEALEENLLREERERPEEVTVNFGAVWETEHVRDAAGTEHAIPRAAVGTVNNNLTYVAMTMTAEDPVEVLVQIDNGSSGDIIDWDVAEAAGLQIQKRDRAALVHSITNDSVRVTHECLVPLTIKGDRARQVQLGGLGTGVDGEVISLRHTITERIMPKEEAELKLTVWCMAMKRCPVVLLLGANTMRRCQVKLDQDRREVLLGAPSWNDQLVTTYAENDKVQSVLDEHQRRGRENSRKAERVRVAPMRGEEAGAEFEKTGVEKGDTESARKEKIHKAFIKTTAQTKQEKSARKKAAAAIDIGDPLTDKEYQERMNAQNADIAASKVKDAATKAILREMVDPIDDETKDVEESGQYSLSEDTTGKPLLFPDELWKYVRDELRPRVQSHWDRFPPERLAVILEDMKMLDVCPERPNQAKYVRAQALAHLHAYYHVDENDPPLMRGVSASIELTDNTPAVSRFRQNFSFLQMAFLNVKQAELLRTHKVQESNSAYRAPLVLVQYVDRVRAFFEKHGDDARRAIQLPENADIVGTFFRMTQDLRLLNEKTRRDEHPMPRVMNVIDNMAGDRYYSAFDIKDAFWSVMLDIADRHKTAFATHNRLLEWCVMVQGARNSAVIWARIIRSAFSGTPRTIDVFQDDIFTHARVFSESLGAIEVAYDKLEASDLVAKRSKAHINYPRIKCLGHIVSRVGRIPDPGLVKAVVEFKVPETVEDIGRVIGIATYNRSYVEKMAEIVAPIQELKRGRYSGPVVGWRDEFHGVAFRRLKDALTNAPVLQLPELSKPFRVEVDAATVSRRGEGAVLKQVRNDVPTTTTTAVDGVQTVSPYAVQDADWVAVAYFSKPLSETERRYSATEAEAKAMHDAIMHWAVYLQNGLPFEVIVDHQALLFLVTEPAKTANKRILNWVMKLQEFNFRVLYREGGVHTEADALSRLLRFEDVPEEPDMEKAHCFARVTDEDIQTLIKQTVFGEEARKRARAINKAREDERIRSGGGVGETGKEAQHEGLIPTVEEVRLGMARMSAMARDEDFMLLTMVRCVDDDGLDESWPLDEFRGNFSALSEGKEGRECAGGRVREADEEGEQGKQDERIEVHFLSVEPKGTRFTGKAADVLIDQDAQLVMEVVDPLTGRVIEVAMPERTVQYRCSAGRINSRGVRRIRNELGMWVDEEPETRAMEPPPAAQPLKTQGTAAAGDSREGAAWLPPSEEELATATNNLKAPAMKRAESRGVQADKPRAPSKSEVQRERKAVKEQQKLDKRIVEDALRKTAMEQREKKKQDKEADQAKRRDMAQQERVRAAREKGKANRTAEQLGPKKLQNQATDRFQEDDEGLDPELKKKRDAGEQRAAGKDDLVGRHYIHPKTDRLYEVMYVYWDVASNMVACYRRAADGEMSSEDDQHPYQVEGPRGVEALVMAFEEAGGLADSIQKWPREEFDMVTAQKTDPWMIPMFEKLARGEKVTVPANAARGPGREARMWQPELAAGAKGALRCEADGATRMHEVFSEGEGRVLMPTELRPLVMRFCHDGMGHPGRDRALASLKLRYFWPTMTEDLEQHVGICRFCKLRKSEAGRGAALPPTQRYTTSVKPFQRIHADLTGILPKTKRGYQYILVVKDSLTGWVELIPLFTKEATEVAQAMVDGVFCRHGSAETVVSDRGSEFVNKTMRAVDFLMAQRHVATTPYNPRANGLVETQNRPLKDMLASYIQKHQRDWDDFLSVVQHSYNTTVNSATGYSPFRALYGREARQPSHAWIQEFANAREVSVDEYVGELQKALNETWKDIGARVEGKHRLVDARVAPNAAVFKPFEAGDSFYLKSMPRRSMASEDTASERERLLISAKLQFRYTGPHVVIRALNPVVYEARVNGRIKVVHAMKMKRDYHSDGVPHTVIPWAEFHRRADQLEEEQARGGGDDDADVDGGARDPARRAVEVRPGGGAAAAVAGSGGGGSDK